MNDEILGYKHVDVAITESLEMIRKIASGELVPLRFKLSKERERIGGLYPSDMMTIAARTGMGKCLARNTPVLMFDGSIKMSQDIAVDDLLMGDDSTPRRVTSLARGREMMYRIHQLKGDSYDVNESHIISLKLTGTNQVVNISVRDYLNKSTKWKHCHKGYKVGVEFADKEYYMDAYVLGVWLGDGDAHLPRFTISAQEVEDHLVEYAKELECNITSTKADGCNTVYISNERGENKFTTQLRHYNLIDNKHIPRDYLINSRETRLQLLAGLLDTDGYLTSNCYEITQKNKELAEQIQFLAHSLGFRAVLSEKVGKIKSLGFEGLYYKVVISGNVDCIPMKVGYKKIVDKKPNKNHLVCGITVEQLEVDDYYGFTLDGNRLFVLGDFTVTHNTAKVVNLIQNFLDPELNASYVGKIIILFDSWEMVDWRMMMRMYSKVGKLTVKELLDYEVRLAAEKIELVNTLANQFKGQPLYFVKSNRNVDQWVKSKERIQKQFPEHLIVNVTDHMRLVTRSNEKSEEQLITDFSKAQMYVKTSMGQICVPLSQMNRAIEQGGRGEELGNRLPIASDLFGSDAIFQCSDIVMALHRPGYYGLTYWNYGNMSYPTGITDDPESTDSLMVECILKQRDGWTGNILVTHNLKYNDFMDYTEF